MTYIIYGILFAFWVKGFRAFFLTDFKRTWGFTKESTAWTDRGLGLLLMLGMLVYPITFVVVVTSSLLLAGHGTFIEGCKKVWDMK